MTLKFKTSQVLLGAALSALISGIGLATLLRTSSLWIAAGVAVLAIASKFLFRWDGRHVMNPTNCALVVMLALGAPIWVSPGQYGHVTFVAFAICAIVGGSFAP